MLTRILIAGTAALLVATALPAFAQDLAGGAVKVMSGADGNYLADANGMTLYTYDKDSADTSTCYDKCAENWPPLAAGADAQSSGDFQVVDRKDGSKMWAYKDKPLYTWAKDTKPGDMTGNGVGQVWHTATE